MCILIAPDSFKGSLSAVDAAHCMMRGAKRVFPDAEYDLIPIADGGEGTVDALVAATGGELHNCTVQGPLGAPVTARWGLLGDGRGAVVEMAAASGLPLLAPDERDPLRACTFGTGQLIAEALETLHARTQSRPAEVATAARPSLLLGIGGSATNDGGVGALRALGLRFYDDAGRDLPPGGAALARLARIDATGIHPLLAVTDIRIACDVDNPLCGPLGAAAVFGPQKGAGPDDVRLLDAALAHFAVRAREISGKDVAALPGAGAAGGFGAGFMFFTQAVLCSGVDMVLEATGFAARAARADLVLTGEGHTDFQTAHGKAPTGVARAAKRLGKAVLCISGGLGKGYADIYSQGIDAAASAVCAVTSLEDCMATAAPMLEDGTERACRLLRLGMNLAPAPAFTRGVCRR